MKYVMRDAIMPPIITMVGIATMKMEVKLDRVVVSKMPKVGPKAPKALKAPKASKDPKVFQVDPARIIL